MGFKNNNNNNNNTEKVYIDLEAVGYSVTNVRVVSDNLVTFTLSCRGFAFYNMRLIEKKAGSYFISVPQDKGTNGAYYNKYAVYLSEEDEKALIEYLLEAVKNA